MKQICLVIWVVLIYVAAVGQATKAVEKSWNIELGPAVAHPIHYLNTFSTLGFGLDGAITHPIGNGFAAGVRINYLYFSGRAAEPFFTGGGSHYKHSNLYDALVEGSYCYNNTIIIGLNLGLSVLTFNAHSDPSFAWGILLLLGSLSSARLIKSKKLMGGNGRQ